MPPVEAVLGPTALMAPGARPRLRAAILLLPAALLVLCQGQVGEALPAVRVWVGIAALALSSGYALMYGLRLDPLMPGGGAGRWALVIPLSLALDVAIATALAITPIGLTACRLSAALTLVVAALGAAGRRQTAGMSSPAQPGLNPSTGRDR